MTLPTTSPRTDLNGFMPNTTQPVGFHMLSIGGSLAYSLWTTVWDDAKPFMALYHTYSRSAYLYGAYIMGEIITPYLVSDTYTSGNVGWIFQSTETLAGPPTYTSVQIYDSLGVKTSSSLNFLTTLTEGNMKTADGNYLWDAVSIIGPTGFKGYIHTDIVKVIGAYNASYMKLFDSGGELFLKCHQALALPYASGVPIFPPG